MTTKPMIDSEPTTRDELAEYLTNVCTFAKRQQRIVERYTTDKPSEWTKAHRLMDGPLDDWLASRA